MAANTHQCTSHSIRAISTRIAVPVNRQSLVGSDNDVLDLLGTCMCITCIVIEILVEALDVGIHRAANHNCWGSAYMRKMSVTFAVDR